MTLRVEALEDSLYMGSGLAMRLDVWMYGRAYTLKICIVTEALQFVVASSHILGILPTLCNTSWGLLDTYTSVGEWNMQHAWRI